MTRRALARLALVVAGIAAGLAAAEGLVRLGSPVPGEDLFYGGLAPTPTGLVRWSPTLGREPVPGAEAHLDRLGWTNDVRINALGMRGELPGAGPKWLAVGDSFTFALQVPEADTFEARLGAEFGVQVLNGGCDNYSTVQAARRYAALREHVDVDRVIALFFLGNDLTDNRGADRRLQATRPPDPPTEVPPPGAWSTVQRYSMLAAWLNVWQATRQLERGQVPNNAGFRDSIGVWSTTGGRALKQLMPATRAALTELRDTAAAHGDPLLVAVAPPSFAVDPASLQQVIDSFGLQGERTDAPRSAVLAALRELGVPSCDLWKPLADAYARGERPYLRFDGHWNRTGHRIAAEAIAACIRDAPSR